MRFIIIFLTFLTNISLSWAQKPKCRIIFYDTIFYSPSEFNITTPFKYVKKSDCSFSDIKNTLHHIIKMDGYISEKYFNKFYDNKIQADYISFFPEQYKFINIKSYIHQVLGFKSSESISDINIETPKKIIILKKNEYLKVGNLKHFRYGPQIFVGEVGKHKKFFFSGTLKKWIYAYKIKQNASIFDLDLKNIIQKVKILTEHPEQYFQNLENIIYFRPNKYLTKNYIIKNSDLTPKKIIRSGQKVNVIIKRPKLKIKTYARAREDGYYDQNISLYYEKNKKIIVGKAIHFNTVVIQ